MTKNAIVTGANRGIGRAIALELATEGYNIAISYRSDKDGADKTVEMIQATGQKAKAIHADFTQEGSIEAFFKKANDFLKTPDVLVNNAGGYNTSKFFDVTEDALLTQYQINSIAPIMLSKYMAKNLIQRKSPGSIINISSIATTNLNLDRIAFSPTKAALDTATKLMALEFMPHHVRVNAIAPGYVPYEEVQQTHRLDRDGSPLDLAKMVSYLVSDSASWITGQIINVDGGLSIKR